MLASRTGDVGRGTVLLRRRANPNAKETHRGTTPMMWAADEGTSGRFKCSSPRVAIRTPSRTGRPRRRSRDWQGKTIRVRRWRPRRRRSPARQAAPSLGSCAPSRMRQRRAPAGRAGGGADGGNAPAEVGADRGRAGESGGRRSGGGAAAGDADADDDDAAVAAGFGRRSATRMAVA